MYACMHVSMYLNIHMQTLILARVPYYELLILACTYHVFPQIKVQAFITYPAPKTQCLTAYTLDPTFISKCIVNRTFN